MPEEMNYKERILSCRCYMTDQKIAYAEICIGSDRIKAVPLRSREFMDWARCEAYKDSKFITNDRMNLYIETLEATARFNNEERVKTSMRVGKSNEKFYYDIGEETYIEMSKKGYMRVRTTPICFLRNDNMLDQVEPIEGDRYTLWDLRKFINVKSDDEFDLLLIAIISYFIPEIPHHILIFIGNQGSSKSTVSRIIKRIVDPSTVDIYSLPNNKADLILHLNNAHLIPYDNLNSIKREFNDVLCQVATGGNFLKRTLYTDSELSVYSLQRTLILNGISLATNQPDLLDRSIVVNLKTIDKSERRTERELFNEFEERLPYFLHHIFETVSKAMKLYETIELKELPRMADATLWSCAIAEALGISKEEYIKLYLNNQKSINTEILSENAVAFTLMKFMQKHQTWKGPVRSLWSELDWIADNHDINKGDATWAKSPSYLSRYLNQLKVNLMQEGIRFEIRNKGTHKEIELEKIKSTLAKKKKKVVTDGERAENEATKS